MGHATKKRFLIWEYLLILGGSILYALGTVLFIFPNGLLLGGTSGISVILTAALPFSPGMILTAINFALIILAFAVLGKQMAAKTLIGSVLTTVFIALFERVFSGVPAPITNPYIAAPVGAAVIALASGILFFVDSSSGGTDILALIVRKLSGIQIGKALLITDVLIVLVGGLLSGVALFVGSFVGLLVKTLGIDLVIWVIKKCRPRKDPEKEKSREH